MKRLISKPLHISSPKTALRKGGGRQQKWFRTEGIYTEYIQNSRSNKPIQLCCKPKNNIWIDKENVRIVINHFFNVSFSCVLVFFPTDLWKQCGLFPNHLLVQTRQLTNRKTECVLLSEINHLYRFHH